MLSPAEKHWLTYGTTLKTDSEPTESYENGMKYSIKRKLKKTLEEIELVVESKEFSEDRESLLREINRHLATTKLKALEKTIADKIVREEELPDFTV